ncbi:AAA family ATPase [Actinoallomurus sp. CA-150999]|uniref:AAA family ATPase n=1 Tax=Actinoallomurus sp. CA-150999 TaxID=3239887 RepID=UPI003D8D4152
MTDQADDWLIYRGAGVPHDGITRLPPPPPWRAFGGGPPIAPAEGGFDRRGVTYQPATGEVEAVNAALYLRRPLLVTGAPGSGKSTLAYSIAHELGLGPVLSWPITSRSTLQEGLYRYDAIGRLQDAQVAVTDRVADVGSPWDRPEVARYISLGPLGTALLPWDRPRVVLIDELDNSDIDLPNDLLNIFEEGAFVIPELARLAHYVPDVEIAGEGGNRVLIRHGEIRCRTFPIVVITSSGEREFPPRMLRRCVRLQLAPPSIERLSQIVTAHLGEEAMAQASTLIERFLEARRYGETTTDQLLNAIYLATSGLGGSERRARLADEILRSATTDDG